MTPIQIIIVVVLILLAIVVARNVNAGLTRIILFLILLSGIAFALQPELSTKMAGWVGVGRGADLVFYLAILFFFFLFLKLYSKIRKLEQKLTELIRRQAIHDVKEEEDSDAEQ